MVIGHNVVVILFIVVRKLLRFAEFDAAPAEVEQLRSQHLVPLRSAAEKDRVAAGMRHGAFLDCVSSAPIPSIAADAGIAA